VGNLSVTQSQDSVDTQDVKDIAHAGSTPAGSTFCFDAQGRC